MDLLKWSFSPEALQTVASILKNNIANGATQIDQLAMGVPACIEASFWSNNYTYAFIYDLHCDSFQPQYKLLDNKITYIPPSIVLPIQQVIYLPKG